MLTVFPKRHTLLQLSEAGRQAIWANRETICPRAEAWASQWDEFADIPVITRRWDETAGWISVGMSLPLRTGNNRWRMSSHISPSAVSGIITPEQAAEKSSKLDHPCAAVLRTAAAPAREFGIRVGVFGSTALAGVTGLPYLHEDSDLDLVLEATSEHGLREFAALLQNLEKKYRIHIDTEITLNDGYYVKLKELLSGQKTILAKGKNQPVLLSTRTALQSFSGTIEL